MNSWKFNSSSSHWLRRLISMFFQINVKDVYKKIKKVEIIENTGIYFHTDDKKIYLLTLKEVKDENS